MRLAGLVGRLRTAAGRAIKETQQSRTPRSTGLVSLLAAVAAAVAAVVVAAEAVPKAAVGLMALPGATLQQRQPVEQVGGPVQLKQGRVVGRALASFLEELAG